MVAWIIIFALLDVYVIGEFGAGEASSPLALWLALVPAVYGTYHGFLAMQISYGALKGKSRLNLWTAFEGALFCLCQLFLLFSFPYDLMRAFDHPIVIAMAWLALFVAVGNEVRSRSGTSKGKLRED